MIKVFTAFSGYDSQCLALERCGLDYDLVGWSEIDKYAIRAHDALFPQYADRNFGDISKVDWKQVPDFDLFTYSFPCQDLSKAGKQRGFNKGSGTRSSLLWECQRAIEEKTPKYLVMENVSDLVSKKFVGMYNEWMRYLQSMGYRSYSAVLNAKNYGIPQNRARVYCVSILGDGDAYYFPDKMPLKKRLIDMLEDNVDESYYLSKEKLENFIFNCEDSSEKAVLGWTRDNQGNIVNRHPVSIANCITSNKRDNTQNFVFDPTIQFLGDLNPNSKFGNHAKQQNIVIGVDGISMCLTAQHAKHEFKIAEPLRIHQATEQGYTEVYPGGVFDASYPNSTTRRGRVQDGGTICPTLCAKQTEILQYDGYRIRRLTERECYRLMGLTEGEIDKIQSAGIPKTWQYHTAGNSIVVDVLVAIFSHLFLNKKNDNQQLKLF